jgi:RNA polymerase sigma-70 factor (ECF subfamily)
MLVVELSEVSAATDGDLARLALARGEASGDAEEELCRRLGPRVRLYGLRHLRDEQAAADLTQQVLLITLENLRSGRLREPDRIASFVLGTCRMTVLEMRRGGARREVLLDRFAREFSTSGFPQSVMDLDALARCLEQLAERERSVVVMTFYDEQSGDAVAGALGLSPANVRVIRHRALGRLRGCLTAPGGRA